jgi:5-methylcytosine-specific restriction endonuclease McrA
MAKKEKKATRQAFRDAVFKRDGHKCRVCNKGGTNIALDAHHIINRNFMSGGGYVLENGISLCPECHEKAEAELNKFLKASADKETYLPNGKFSPAALYKLVGSSFEKAVKAASKLTNV